MNFDIGIFKIPLYIVGGLGLAVCAVRARNVLWKWGSFDPTKKDMTGKIVVITGANSGLGLVTAKVVAKQGAKVIMACRNMKNGQKALEEVKNYSGSKDVTLMELDLASLNSVNEFFNALKRDYPSIDVVVCNAGVFYDMSKKALTRDGFEIHFGVNYLSHFMLVKLLLDSTLLKNSPDSRIIFVSSSLMNSGKVDVDKKDFIFQGRPGSSGKSGYCDSKLMMSLMNLELGKRLPNIAANCSTYAVCPGWCLTGLGRQSEMPLYKKILVSPIIAMFMRSSWRGSQNITHAIMEDKDKLVSGAFYRDCEPAKKEIAQLNAMSDVAIKLWTISEKLLSDRKYCT